MVSTHAVCTTLIATVVCVASTAGKGADLSDHPHYTLLEPLTPGRCGDLMTVRVYGGRDVTPGQYPWIAMIGYRADLSDHPHYTLLEPLTPGRCGDLMTVRVYGGRDVTPGQHPWIAMIGYRWWGGVAYRAGGTIITKRYILTAAHNHDLQLNMIPVKVKLGEYDLWTDPDCFTGWCAPPVQVIDVEDIVTHNQFVEIPDPFDIALLRLASPIQFNEFVSPACLPVGEAYHTLTEEGGEMAEVAGWGETANSRDQMSHTLQSLKVRLWSWEECRRIYESLGEGHLCAGGVAGEDSCVGDSGGPLVQQVMVGGTPGYYLIGVVSFGGEDCGLHNVPGVYTNVIHFMPWILDNIRP